MLRTFGMMVMGLCLLAVSGCIQTEEGQTVLAKSCSLGETTYGFIIAASTTGNISDRNKELADGLYAQLRSICDKGPAANDADVVLAGFQAYNIVKIWRAST